MSTDIVWFIKIKSEEKICEEIVTDNYGGTDAHGHKFFKGRYLEKKSSKKNNNLFEPMNKLTFVYTASVVFLFVTYEHTNKGLYSIFNAELCEIIAYLEYYNFEQILNS